MNKYIHIIQYIKPINIFTTEDKTNITEMIADLITIYIKEDTLSFQYEDDDVAFVFRKNVKSGTSQNFYGQRCTFISAR